MNEYSFIFKETAMKVLVTGAMGIVGLNAIAELARRGHRVRVFDLPTNNNRRTAKKLQPGTEIVWGDVRNLADVRRAVSGVDAVIHLAAIIPPLADRKPALAEAVNVGGTANVVRALEESTSPPKLVFTSSISVYGDRVADPYIGLDDPLAPNPDDAYAHHKIACEGIIRRYPCGIGIMEGWCRIAGIQRRGLQGHAADRRQRRRSRHPWSGLRQTDNIP